MFDDGISHGASGNVYLRNSSAQNVIVGTGHTVIIYGDQNYVRPQVAEAAAQTEQATTQQDETEGQTSSDKPAPTESSGQAQKVNETAQKQQTQILVQTDTQTITDSENPDEELKLRGTILYSRYKGNPSAKKSLAREFSVEKSEKHENQGKVICY